MNNRPNSSNLYSKDASAESGGQSSASDNSSSKPPARRSSGVPKPKSRRSTDSRTGIQKLQPKSMRTGKQLSSIPAERILPMSPLVELPVSRMTADMEELELGVNVRGKVKGGISRPNSRRRSTSLDRFSEQGGSDDSSTGRGGINSDTETSRRLSLSGSESDQNGRGDSRGPRRKLARQSFGSTRSLGSENSSVVSDSSNPVVPAVPSMNTVSSRQSTGGTTGTQTHTSARSTSAGSRSQGDKDKRLSSASAGGSIMIQGKREDDSFKYQIAQLHADNEEEHLLFNSPELLGDDEDDDDMRIRVVIRKRPMSRAEITAAGDVDVIHPLDYGSYGRILAYHPKTRVNLTKEIETVPFSFDNVFDDKSTNLQIYERSVRNLIPCLFEGQWASIFAYGQTGSGKTFTMMGSNLTSIRDGSSTVEPSNLGLYYMAALDLFQAIQTPGFEHFTIGVSLFEIYGGKLFDLLNDRKHIKCLEDSRGKVCFPGLSEHGLSNPDELISLIEHGASNRSTGTTSRNADSSRSHAVLQLHLRTPSGKNSNKEHSRLTFIDLAGSERGADTSSSSRATRLEGAEINTSLLALKEVIRALATSDSLAHVPFRGSKLTQVLKESFVGENCRSVMIACISPNIGNCEQTLNTLRYADRVKERNSETGEPSTNAQESAMRRSSNRKSAPIMSSFTDLSSAGVSVSSNRRSSDNSFASDNSSLLDDLLSPTPMKEPMEEHEERPTDSRSDARNMAEALIAEHKSTMSTMLNMVKDEMVLVNQADADRESLDDYINNLNKIHDEQISLFVNLREAILRYRNASIAEGGISDDDSIEDLRD
jgi:kinesin family protein 2/24